MALCVQVIVQGIKTVERAVINQEKNGKYGLLVEGTDLQVRQRGFDAIGVRGWGCCGGLNSWFCLEAVDGAHSGEGLRLRELLL